MKKNTSAMDSTTMMIAGDHDFGNMSMDVKELKFNQKRDTVISKGRARLMSGESDEEEEQFIGGLGKQNTKFYKPKDAAHDFGDTTVMESGN